MCGIAGFTNYNSNIDKNTIIKKMTDSIKHRGPDNSGFHISKSITLGHRRLEIIDLKSGKQPIYNENKSICTIFNGEIYNFKELRSTLIKKGHSFKTNSDTEVIVHLYEDKGENFPQYLNGMFAIALWDNNKELLILAKDRAGKKPLYYGLINNELVFASELKTFLHYPHFKKEIDHNSIYKYLAYEYIPSPHSIFKGINKLPAGFCLKYTKNSMKTFQYWDYNINPNYNLTENDILENLDTLIEKAVKLRLISDVPLGVFLSGGIDSSIIVYYMSQLLNKRQIKSFSIGFEDKSFDESNYAREIAQLFNTNHHEKILSPSTLINIIPKIQNFLDEPFADASIIPTFLLSQFTKENVTVALGGDGGDELFMGYPTFQANKLANIYKLIPTPIHYIINKTAQSIPTSFANISLDFKIKQFLYAAKNNENIREQLWLGAFSPQNIKKLIPKYNNTNEKLFSQTIYYNKKTSKLKPLDQLSYLYFKTYLHDDILCKVDRATMSVSLESRAPFLDVNLMNYIAKIPHQYKLKNLTTKYILKKLMKNKLPQHILKRTKKGFGIPVGRWFRNELKELIYDTLNTNKIKNEGFFNHNYINQLLNQHSNGKKDNRKQLWTLFMFELWLEKWGN